MTLDDYIPMPLWGKDHWSTLAYAETVMVDCGGFQVGFDPRMRQGRRHYRVMMRQCPRPKRSHSRGRAAASGVVMDLCHSTRLPNGEVVEGHDDWHCIQDLAEAGFFQSDRRVVAADAIEPGVTLHLSPAGQAMAEALRRHKAAGGTFGDFQPPAQT